jgi:succinate dehydrogenase/fumarate reductase flavoprotein subunit
LCGKLRNIIALNKAEEQELSNLFEKDFNSRVSLLTKKSDDQGKYVLINDKDELNNIVKNVENQMVEKLQRDLDKVMRHNSSVVSEMQQKLSHQNLIIQEMQETIKKLKKEQTNEH